MCCSCLLLPHVAVCRNLNFNMLGGNLTALEQLPDIFPNLRHLG
jgi:hypothetical protein